MCGIAAFIGNGSCCHSNLMEIENMIGRMLNTQRFRGPDASSIDVLPLRSAVGVANTVVLGHNRLAILDLDPRSNQPMFDDNRSVCVVFNGEIFNFKDLKKQLQSYGYQFRTTCDTEILLYAYRKWGEGFVAKLSGQFAFVLYDLVNGVTIAARDHTGIKPLYWYKADEGRFVFSSNFVSLVKEFRVTINREALNEYLILRSVLPPDTLVSEIKQVTPGHYLFLRGKEVIQKQYYRINSSLPVGSFEQARGSLYELVSKSIQNETLTSDVPVSLFLSGGLDSSALALVSSAVNPWMRSVSINFGSFSHEENEYSQRVAGFLNLAHNVCYVGGHNFRDLIGQSIDEMDHPDGARDRFAVYMMARHLKNLFPENKVVLMGTGPDELFNGYDNAYHQAACHTNVLIDIVEDYVLKYGFTHHNGFGALNSLGFTPDVKAVASKVATMLQMGIDRLPEDPFSMRNLFRVKVHLSLWELPVADSTIARFSMEGRVPFLAPSIIDYAFSMPSSYKLYDGVEKHILREAFKGREPKIDFAITRPKVPFSRQVMEFMVDHYMKSSVMEIGNLGGTIDTSKLQSLNVHDHFDIIWRILTLDRWLSNNLSVRF